MVHETSWKSKELSIWFVATRNVDISSFVHSYEYYFSQSPFHLLLRTSQELNISIRVAWFMNFYVSMCHLEIGRIVCLFIYKCLYAMSTSFQVLGCMMPLGIKKNIFLTCTLNTECQLKNFWKPHHRWECKMGQVLWKKLDMQLLGEPAIPLLDIYLREMKTCLHKNLSMKCPQKQSS